MAYTQFGEMTEEQKTRAKSRDPESEVRATFKKYELGAAEVIKDGLADPIIIEQDKEIYKEFYKEEIEQIRVQAYCDDKEVKTTFDEVVDFFENEKELQDRIIKVDNFEPPTTQGVFQSQPQLTERDKETLEIMPEQIIEIEKKDKEIRAKIKQLYKATKEDQNKSQAEIAADNKQIQADIKLGRPTVFNDKIRDRICELIADSKSLRIICEDDEMPGESTIYTELNRNKTFQEQYTRAREISADRIFEGLIALADTATDRSYNAQRLQIDTRKWVVSKMLPTKYGDTSRVQVDMDIKAVPLSVSDAKQALSFAESYAQHAIESIKQAITEPTGDVQEQSEP